MSILEDQGKIDLGFADKFEHSWLNKCKYFPSKIGGKVSFLVLDPILGSCQLTCSQCQRIMRFVLQIYAPVDTNKDAFHRTIYIFACGASEQCANEFRVFRSQLPKVNRFYSDIPPNYDKDSLEYDPNPQTFGVKLCPVCGIYASSHCAQCSKINYCSREHQIYDWRYGGHKKICKSLVDGEVAPEVEVTSNPETTTKNICFPEYELLIDDSEEDDDDINEEPIPLRVAKKLKPGLGNYEDDEDEDDSDDDQEGDQPPAGQPKPPTLLEMKKYHDFVQKNKPVFQDEDLTPYVQSQSNENQDEEPTEEQEDEEQKTFDTFKSVTIADEVIRYRKLWFESDNDKDQKDDILWISCKNLLDLDKDIPNCANCGTKRVFEFQVMPQLLNKLLLNNSNNEDHLDWGTLLVFSCPNSCTPKLNDEQSNKSATNVYMPEFIYNQKIVS